ncbi:ATP-NAD kinase [Schizophyllum commune H4-8]|uniref:NAD+ kinase n=1 Tax=Schizophyllum commune (strain H4-8 / FGSC 9210) TaxID=578458 RepID=D8Q628_SCHCM|nr:ATP-NAD kinase [Schizophyllum commune H4-8]KAI5891907.1 ATP-NAD kinase [Schizophyllum commune H4-8]
MDHDLRPSISRRSSRPSSLNLAYSANGFKSDIPRQALRGRPPLNSPCFVRSHLDMGNTLAEALRKHSRPFGDNANVGVAKSLIDRGNGAAPRLLPDSLDSNSDSDGEYSSSLTKQLTETAVGVREMSKQLGRARIYSNIQNVLIITKARDNRLIKPTRDLALYLMLKPRAGSPRGLVVYVDSQLRTSRRFDATGIQRDHPELFALYPKRRASSSSSLSSARSSMTSLTSLGSDQTSSEEGQLRYWTSDMCSNSPRLFDFVVTLGGDGTVLFTSWLFQRIVPPVLSFALGSLGFLTNFDFSEHQQTMDNAIENGIRVNLRMRFTCTVYRAQSCATDTNKKAIKKASTGEIMMRVEKGGWEAVEGGWQATPVEKKHSKNKEIKCFTTRPVETFEILNDLVVDRGPSPYVSQLELLGDEHHMTTVQADGLCDPDRLYCLLPLRWRLPRLPGDSCLLLTPICPHTLSFRPMLLPDSMELRICVPFNSRSTAWASFNGRGRIELKQGDHIKVTASKYPFPTVCADKQFTDWFQAISRTLKWNERERQKSFVVGDDESDEEEDTFDIDDSSPEAQAAKQPPMMISLTNAMSSEHINLGQQKTKENLDDTAQRQQQAHCGTPNCSNCTSLNSAAHFSGVSTPSRFATGSPPHPTPLPPRDYGDLNHHSHHPHHAHHLDAHHHHPEGRAAEREGIWDNIHVRRTMSGKSRIPKERDVDDARTPTMASALHGRMRGRTRSRSRSWEPGKTLAVSVCPNYCSARRRQAATRPFLSDAKQSIFFNRALVVSQLHYRALGLFDRSTDRHPILSYLLHSLAVRSAGLDFGLSMSRIFRFTNARSPAFSTTAI